MAWNYDENNKEYTLNMGDTEARITMGDVTVLSYTTPTDAGTREEQVHYTAETGDLEKAVLVNGKLKPKQSVSWVHSQRETMLKARGLSATAKARLAIILDGIDD